MTMTYLDFVAERHRVWERRQKEFSTAPVVWTDDPVLAAFKFTNVFRVLDAGSQFLLKMLNEPISFSEKVFRAFLYRYTNRPEPYVAFHMAFGRYPLRSDAENGDLLA